MRERLINRRQQGDLGEASAIEWLTSKGATVFVPLGHSPDVDLIADMGGRQLRIQVKTTTRREGRSYTAMIATNGGNQSWTGLTKFFDPVQCDALFVLVGNGRRWFIPSAAVDGRRAINLGGPKYAEFEVEEGTPIEHLVYGIEGARSRIGDARGSFGVGEPSEIVNLVPSAEWVRIPPPPLDTSPTPPIAIARTRVSSNHQVTIPVGPFRSANLQVGDLIRVESAGDGSIVLERVQPSQAQQVLPVAG